MKKRTKKPTNAELQAFDDLRTTLLIMRDLFETHCYQGRPEPFVRLCETLGLDPWGDVVAPPPKAKIKKASKRTD